MLKKTITYKDLDGNDVTEDFYFNLSKAEIAEMQLSHNEGFDTYLRSIIESQDGATIITEFKKFLMASIGRRSEDGKRFVKSQEITDEFMQTDAYSQMFMEIITEPNAAAEFIKGIMPADLAEKVGNIEDISLPDGGTKEPAYIRENREPTAAELQAMSKEELQQAFAHKKKLAQE